MRIRLVGVVVGVLSFGLAAAWTPGPAGATGGVTVVKVVFQGTGQYTVDQTYTGGGGQCTTHDVWTLGWSSTFTTTVDSDGALAAATGELTSGSPGTAGMSVGGTCAWKNVVPSCSSALSTPSSSPTLTVSGTDPERVEAQSIASAINFACSSPQDGFIVGRDSGVFDAALPDAMSAVVDIPSTEMTPGSSFPVSSSNAPGHVTSPCTRVGTAVSANSACTASLTWDGTITIAADCVTGNDSTAPLCIRKRQKDEAQKAADDYAAAHGRDQEAYKGLGCGPGASNADSREVALACAVASVKNVYDGQMASHNQQLANDPPDPNFGRVAKPTAVPLPKLGALTRAAPAFARLARGYAHAAALIQALVTAQNRASGALLALTHGDSSAAAALRAQDAAVHADATAAERILRGQRALGVNALRKLRRLGRHVGAIAKTIVSARARQADRLAVAALAGIGH
jgi:hypothetical protein